MPNVTDIRRTAIGTRTESGDYGLPSATVCAVGNVALRVAGATPRLVRRRIVARHRFYQAFDDGLAEGQQGISRQKWAVMRDGCGELAGRDVLDIGCAEGFFCREAALAGASRVVGIDSRLGTLLSARFIALEERLPITYRLGVFPTIGFGDEYDVIFCLSVLHHTVSTKDIWKVLIESAYRRDLAKLRKHLRTLRGMIRPGGRCIIEMPYEYEDPAERREVDFDRFTAELIASGFATAKQLGTWEHRDEHRQRKDRILYGAESI